MIELECSNKFKLASKKKNFRLIGKFFTVILVLTCLTTGTCLSFDVEINSGKQGKFPTKSLTKKEQIPEMSKEALADFEPYMQNLQKKIKANWTPPPNKKSNQVILIFKIAKDGSLLSSGVLKSSGIRKVDNAAKEALLKSVPFDKFPDSYHAENIDVQFSFDYNAPKTLQK